MPFQLNKNLAESTLFIKSGKLSDILLKNNRFFSWFILVPRVANNITEIFQLSEEHQKTLWDEISTLSQCAKAYFNGAKINIGILGNLVSQLHIHVIARQHHDPAWPHSPWQSNIPDEKYDNESGLKIINDIQALLA